MLFLCLLLNWINLSHLTKEPDEKRSPGWVMTAVYVVNMISRARCSKWINITGSNLCLDFKNTVYAPYVLMRTSLYNSILVFLVTRDPERTSRNIG